MTIKRSADAYNAGLRFRTARPGARVPFKAAAVGVNSQFPKFIVKRVARMNFPAIAASRRARCIDGRWSAKSSLSEPRLPLR